MIQKAVSFTSADFKVDFELKNQETFSYSE